MAGLIRGRDFGEAGAGTGCALSGEATREDERPSADGEDSEESKMDSSVPETVGSETKDDHAKARGFAAMTAERQREIARRGGKAAHARGTAHEFSCDEAREAGRKGGLAVAKDREYMSKIGREGARKSAVVRRKSPDST
jgi:general stress protein YciG